MEKKTKLNDNEVREVARMQMKIDAYECFISTINAMLVAKRTDLNYILFNDCPLEKEMNNTYKMIKDYIKESKGK